ncbi:MAG TPA: glycerophosphodiester phosphodiesterase [Patescibacteria group bacterium]|jgi:glycerophosphoryl diester phosphodiesterase|nr:glycerophosphodiester phosphodiesterase [Patescibacteria group bacterium]
MLIIGHRGAAALEPENTIRSFKKAQDYRVDMIELDVRLSRDNQLVVFHDHSLQRLFNVTKSVNTATLDELKAISRAAQREIPTFEEALQNISCPIIVHVKVHGAENLLMNAIRRFSHKVVISSTFPGVLKKVRALDENVPLGLVIGHGELHLLPIINWLTKNLNLYSIHPNYGLVSGISIKGLKLLKKKIFVWTVNTPEQYQKVANLGVDGIMTDCPNLFRTD